MELQTPSVASTIQYRYSVIAWPDGSVYKLLAGHGDEMFTYGKTQHSGNLGLKHTRYSR